MRIEFQYNLAEWCEWKRANLNFLQLNLLRTTESLLKPLYLVCALGLIVILLQYLEIDSTFSRSVPEWMPLVFLVLLALANIYLPQLRKQSLKKEWEEWIRQPNYKLEIREEGIDNNSTEAGCFTGWNDFSAVFQTKQLLMFCKGKGPEVLVIPKRAFGGKERLEELLELAHRKIVIERETAEKRKPA